MGADRRGNQNQSCRNIGACWRECETTSGADREGIFCARRRELKFTLQQTYVSRVVPRQKCAPQKGCSHPHDRTQLLSLRKYNPAAQPCLPPSEPPHPPAPPVRAASQHTFTSMKLPLIMRNGLNNLRAGRENCSPHFLRRPHYLVWDERPATFLTHPSQQG